MRAPQEIVGPYLELGSNEATTAKRVYQEARNSIEPLVIGRFDDTVVGAELGMHRLDVQDWSPNVNFAWIQGGADAFQPFYLASNISFENLRSKRFSYPKTVFFGELRQLRDVGYFKEGNWMLSPKK